jgi:hypothetical protein
MQRSVNPNVIIDGDNVTLKTTSYDVELDTSSFNYLKNILNMCDGEVLTIYDMITKNLDELFMKLLHADSSQVFEYNTFTSDDIDSEMLKHCGKLKSVFIVLFSRIQDKYKQSHMDMDNVNKEFQLIYGIINKSLDKHNIQLVSYFLPILCNDIIHEEKAKFIQEQVEKAKYCNENIVTIESSEKEKVFEVLLVTKNNKMMISKIHSEKNQYMLNIQQNTCTCLDFRMRKCKQGLCCKHLMQLRNKSYCLLHIKKVMDSLSNNYNCNTSFAPLKEMLSVVYDENIDYLPKT